MSYPKWIYHKTLDAKVVKTKEEHDEAGKGWEETPFAEDKEQVSKADESQASENEAGSDEAEHEKKQVKKKGYK